MAQRDGPCVVAGTVLSVRTRGACARAGGPSGGRGGAVGGDDDGFDVDDDDLVGRAACTFGVVKGLRERGGASGGWRRMIVVMWVVLCWCAGGWGWDGESGSTLEVVAAVVALTEAVLVATWACDGVEESGDRGSVERFDRKRKRRRKKRRQWGRLASLALPFVNLSATARAAPTFEIRGLDETSSVNFGRVEVGSFKSRTLEIYNTGPDTVSLLRWETLNDQFSLPLFEADEEIKPGDVGNVTVAFVPTLAEAKQQKSTIFLDTSHGRVVIHGIAEPAPSSFGLAAVDREVPSSQMIHDELWLTNPSSNSTLQVLQVYTTESFLHLRVLAEEPSQVWLIGPGERSMITLLAFQSHILGSYRCHVRLKTSIGHMLVPVHYRVVPQTLLVKPASLELGDLSRFYRQRGTVLRHSIELSNLLPDTVAVTSVTTSQVEFRSPAGERLELSADSDERPRMVRARYKAGLAMPPGSHHPDAVVVEIYSWRLPEELQSATVLGQVVLETDHQNPSNSRIVVPVSFRVHSGLVSLRAPQRVFQLNSPNGDLVWDQGLGNCLPVALDNGVDREVTVADIFMSSKLHGGLQLHPFPGVVGSLVEKGASTTVAELCPQPFVIPDLDPNFAVDVQRILHQVSAGLLEQTLQAVTSMGEVSLPFQVFHGFLRGSASVYPHGPAVAGRFGSMKLDLGTTLLGTEFGVKLAFENANSASVLVVSLEVEGFLQVSQVTLRGEPTTLPIKLPPWESLEIDARVQAVQERMESRMQVSTEKEVFSVFGSLKAIKGSLSVENSVFRFEEPVRMFETYKAGSVVEVSSTVPIAVALTPSARNDPRVVFADLVTVLPPETYRPMPVSRVAVQAHQCGLDGKCPDASGRICTRRELGNRAETRQDPWEELVAEHKNRFDVVVHLDTNLTGCVVPVRVTVNDIRCPKVLSAQTHPRVLLPTQVGQESKFYVQVQNPSTTIPLEVRLSSVSQLGFAGEPFPEPNPFKIPHTSKNAVVIEPGESFNLGPIMVKPVMIHAKTKLYGMVELHNNMTREEYSVVSVVATIPSLRFNPPTVMRETSAFLYRMVPTLAMEQAGLVADHLVFNLLGEMLENNVVALRNSGPTGAHVRSFKVWNDLDAFELTQAYRKTSPHPISLLSGPFVLEPGEEIELWFTITAQCRHQSAVDVLEITLNDQDSRFVVLEAHFDEAALEMCGYDYYRWRVSLFLAAIGVFLMFTAMVLLYFENRPEGVGLSGASPQSKVSPKVVRQNKKRNAKSKARASHAKNGSQAQLRRRQAVRQKPLSPSSPVAHGQKNDDVEDKDEVVVEEATKATENGPKRRRRRKKKQTSVEVVSSQPLQVDEGEEQERAGHEEALEGGKGEQQYDTNEEEGEEEEEEEEDDAEEEGDDFNHDTGNTKRELNGISNKAEGVELSGLPSTLPPASAQTEECHKGQEPQLAQQQSEQQIEELQSKVETVEALPKTSEDASGSVDIVAKAPSSTSDEEGADREDAPDPPQVQLDVLSEADTGHGSLAQSKESATNRIRSSSFPSSPLLLPASLPPPAFAVAATAQLGTLHQEPFADWSQNLRMSLPEAPQQSLNKSGDCFNVEASSWQTPQSTVHLAEGAPFLEQHVLEPPLASMSDAMPRSGTPTPPASTFSGTPGPTPFLAAEGKEQPSIFGLPDFTSSPGSPALSMLPAASSPPPARRPIRPPPGMEDVMMGNEGRRPPPIAPSGDDNSNSGDREFSNPVVAQTSAASSARLESMISPSSRLLESNMRNDTIPGILRALSLFDEDVEQDDDQHKS